MTFDSFVAGSSSQAAFDACVAVAEEPGRVHNPLLLHGPSGAGKTHLLTAIELRMRSLHPAMNVLRVPADELATQLTDAIRAHAVPRLRESIARLHALLVDDLRFRNERPRTREAMLALLEHALRAGAQLVISCEAPEHLPGATIVEVGYPDRDARLQLATSEAERLGIAVDVEHIIGEAVSVPSIRNAVRAEQLRAGGTTGETTGAPPAAGHGPGRGLP